MDNEDIRSKVIEVTNNCKACTDKVMYTTDTFITSYVDEWRCSQYSSDDNNDEEDKENKYNKCSDLLTENIDFECNLVLLERKYKTSNLCEIFKMVDSSARNEIISLLKELIDSY